MSRFTLTPVIDVLQQMADGNSVELEDLDESMAVLEAKKNSLNALKDDECIDLLDEIQDFLQYAENADADELADSKSQIQDMIEALRQIE